MHMHIKVWETLEYLLPPVIEELIKVYRKKIPEISIYYCTYKYMPT